MPSSRELEILEIPEVPKQEEPGQVVVDYPQTDPWPPKGCQALELRELVALPPNVSQYCLFDVQCELAPIYSLFEPLPAFAQDMLVEVLFLR